MEKTPLMSRDWKNEKDYSYTKNHTPELWAWEFLRRNPEYRRDWEKALSKWEKNKSHEANSRNKTLNQNCYTKKERPRKLPFENARYRWGLLEPEIIDPDIDIDIHTHLSEFDLPIFYESGHLFNDNEFTILQATGIEKGQVVILFDLQKPIHQQYKKVKQELLERQKEFLRGKKIIEPKNRGKQYLWKKYLRILDAYTVKAKKKEIAQIIFPHVKNEYPECKGSKQVYSCYKLAMELANKRYLKIL